MDGETLRDDQWDRLKPFVPGGRKGRRGPRSDGRRFLMALVQSSLRQKPASGSVFAFRGRRGDRIKLLFWDGQGFCLYYKVLEKGRFPWPSATDGTARLTAAQLSMLWKGIDWRQPAWTSAPTPVA